MDAERGHHHELTFGSVKDRIKARANHPTTSGTLIIFLVLDVAMLIVGILKKNECPVDSRIPIFLIVAGAIGIISKVLPFLNRRLELGILSYVIYALYVFEFIWMIIGSVWVYQIYKPNFNERVYPYCSRSAYLLAFWLLTIRWVLLALSILLGICYCLFSKK